MRAHAHAHAHTAGPTRTRARKPASTPHTRAPHAFNSSEDLPTGLSRQRRRANPRADTDVGEPPSPTRPQTPRASPGGPRPHRTAEAQRFRGRARHAPGKRVDRATLPRSLRAWTGAEAGAPRDTARRAQCDGVGRSARWLQLALAGSDQVSALCFEARPGGLRRRLWTQVTALSRDSAATAPSREPRHRGHAEGPPTCGGGRAFARCAWVAQRRAAAGDRTVTARGGPGRREGESGEKGRLPPERLRRFGNLPAAEGSAAQSPKTGSGPDVGRDDINTMSFTTLLSVLFYQSICADSRVVKDIVFMSSKL